MSQDDNRTQDNHSDVVGHAQGGSSQVELENNHRPQEIDQVDTGMHLGPWQRHAVLMTDVH